MNTRRLLEWGGLAASVVLIVFGAAALYMGFDGRSTVQDSLKQEQIYFGDASDPAVAKYASQWAGPSRQRTPATRRAPTTRQPPRRIRPASRSRTAPGTSG